EGTAETGSVALSGLRVRLGGGGFLASGSWNWPGQAGDILPRERVLLAKDLEAVAKAPLEGAVRGEIDLKSDGKTAGLDLRLQMGGGRIGGKRSSTLEKAAVWDVQLTADRIDPGAISNRAPKGQVTARVSLHGKRMPK